MDDIAHPNLRRLYEYWVEKRGERDMPARANIDPLDITYIVGNVIMVDVIEGDPLRFRIRLHGTNLAQRVGYELTGKMLDELPINDFRALAQQSFTWVANKRQPLHSRRDRIIDGRFAKYETVIMPLSDDGERVNRLLVGLIYDDEKR
jgi:hypothetical protein